MSKRSIWQVILIPIVTVIIILHPGQPDTRYIPDTEEGQQLNDVIGVGVVELHFIQRVDGLCEVHSHSTGLQVNRSYSITCNHRKMILYLSSDVVQVVLYCIFGF